MANEVTGMAGNKSYTATLLLAFFLGALAYIDFIQVISALVFCSF